MGGQGAGQGMINLPMGGGQTQGSQIPGQEARNVDLSGLIGALGQQQPQSGAVSLGNQQAQMGVLQPRPTPYDGPDGVDMGNTTPMADPLAFGSGQDPMSFQRPGLQKQPVSQQGAATGIPNPAQPQGNPGQAQGQGQGVDWGKLMNFTGTAQEPNALVRAGVGYNQGGLIGALGYLLTDMSRQTNGSSNQGF